MEDRTVNQDAAEEKGGETQGGEAPQPAPDRAEGEREGSDAADEASKQSYPASDAPAW